jgi:hypothetical protein
MSVRQWTGTIGATLTCAVIAASLAAAPGGASVTARPPSAWGSPIPVDTRSGSPTGLTGVSCASTSFCAAVDGAGRALQFSGKTWTRPREIDTDPTGLAGVSCPARRFCMAIDTSSFAVQWNGRRWLAPHSIGPDPLPEELPAAVSCPTTSFCAAVDSYGYEFVWRDHRWTHRLAAAGPNFAAVSCSSPRFCLAVAGNGQWARWNGRAWSGLRNAPDNTEMTAVSCLSAAFCAAGGAAAMIFNGHRWSPPDPISSTALLSMSCASRRFCYTGDDLGNVYLWNGARWLAPKEISQDDSLNSASCPTTTFCSVVTAGGNGVFYAPMPKVATSRLPAGTKHRRYSKKLRAAAGTAPYRWSHRGSLPRGLHLSAAGVLSGTPRVSGTFSITFVVGDVLRVSSHRRLKLMIR